MEVLPIELQHMIWSYVGYPEIPSCQVIKDELRVYYNDHSRSLTKIYGKYFIHNIFSFSTYYFDKRENPGAYLSMYEDM